MVYDRIYNRHFERHPSGLVAHSTEWLQYQYEQGVRKTGRFTAVVWPTSRWKMNQQMPGILVLTSYLFLICL